MAVEYKDYYKTLGVSKKASAKEIKSAYRKLARKYHPDVNPGDKEAEAKFKEINEAHAVLTDPEKRKKYDTLGPDWEKRFQGGFRPGGGGTYTYTTGPGMNAGDFSDFFETLFGQRGPTGSTDGSGRSQGGFDFDLGSIFGRGRGRTQAPAPQRGSDLEQSIDISLAEAFRGVERGFTLQVPQTCEMCNGSGLKDNDICPTCRGTGTTTRNRRLDVKIPAGVKDGQRIRVAGEGSPGTAGGPKGDLFLKVHVLPDSRFRREGDNLYTEIPVPITKLALGGEVEVPTLTGRLTVSVPPGSQNGRSLRLSGQGMPRLKEGGRGDLYVKLNAVLPTTLTEQQRELFEQLAQAGM